MTHGKSPQAAPVLPFLFSITAAAAVAHAGETLYNGITLPDVWPPRAPVMSAGEPMPVPYLAHPPAVIPIDVGRQLLSMTS